jgi:pimeloyl-ACP methyl ester carboxylesterase
MKKIILLHGALGAKTELLPLMDLLSQQFQVYCVEFQGHGQTPIQTGFSIPDFAVQLKKFVEHNACQGAAVFGYSMGGYVALYLASQYPNLLGEIITLGTKFNWTPDAADKEVKMLNPEKIEEKVPKFAAYLASLHGADNWKTQMQNTAQLMLDLCANDDLAPFFSIITNRCFIGLGELDEMVTLEETRHAINQIPNAQFFSMEKTMHPIVKVDLKLLSEKLSEILE